ncbi:RagB/SusD family nutrient uptake outer membrane protein [uncultured Bacteroides sp.]|uniref:RagB/SusD family nutrient uptake outer membrane protein n=1 Tax=uncultured Bacteroides sp. TaxID=162156 RepID=UPI002AABAFF2|nr:RagB/SusD family nutrient uptake outer membrane protein [uncultured Bacteroides sp.]
MKSYIKNTLFAGLLLSSATACTDLNVDIKSTYTSYPTSEIATEAKMADLYYGFRGPLGRRYTEAALLSSDEFTAVTFGGNWYDGGNYVHSSLHMTNPDDAHIDWLGDITGTITKCNQAIVDLGGEDATDKSIAKALTMRAFYHFIFMDMFGDAPILDHVVGDGEAVERSSRADVAAFIEEDLLRAINSGGLSEDVDASTYGKPTKWMAEALLVKLYLNWAVYTSGDVANYEPTLPNSKLNDAVQYCDEIIKSGKFNLSDSYRKKFMPDNGYQIKDFIYAMPYDNATAQGMTYARFQYWPKFNNDGGTGPGLLGVSLVKNAGGIFTVTPEAADRFNLQGDERNEIILKDALNTYNISTFAKTTTPYIYNGKRVVLTKNITLLKADDTSMNVGDDFKGWTQGYRCIKWAIQAIDYNTYGRNQSNDVPIFRYADILLMKAEAILRGATATNNDTPMSLFNQIRSYVKAPTMTTEPTLQDVLDERGREFFSEMWRRNDLIRFGQFENDWGLKHVVNPTAKTQKFRRIFPIPTNVMNSNTNWVQNTGYNQ